MGWKGTVSSIQAANNQAKRNAQRRQREHEKHQARLAKMAELDRAQTEVEMFDEYISSLETLHGVEVSEIDWAAIALSSEPSAPRASNSHERAAKEAFEGFKPKLLESKKRQAARRAELQGGIGTAAEQDVLDLENARAQHLLDLEGWVVAGDIDALADASEQIEGFGGDDRLRYIEFTFSDEESPTVTIGVAPIEDVVPKEQLSLLASGKLSVKQMPKGRFHEIYQDYVCGVALLVANAALGMLPIENLIVNAQSEMLNTSTGHIEETAILSLFVPRDTMGRLNLGRVDASDAMSNFVHNMKFMKTKGFQLIEPVAPPAND